MLAGENTPPNTKDGKNADLRITEEMDANVSCKNYILTLAGVLISGKDWGRKTDQDWLWNFLLSQATEDWTLEKMRLSRLWREDNQSGFYYGKYFIY